MESTVWTQWRPDSPRSKLQEIKLLFFAFAALGSVSAGALSDVFGRRVIFASFAVWSVLVGLLASVAPSLITFEVLWCMVAFGIMGSHVANLVSLVDYAFCLELLPGASPLFPTPTTSTSTRSASWSSSRPACASPASC